MQRLGLIAGQGPLIEKAGVGEILAIAGLRQGGHGPAAFGIVKTTVPAVNERTAFDLLRNLNLGLVGWMGLPHEPAGLDGKNLAGTLMFQIKGELLTGETQSRGDRFGWWCFFLACFFFGNEWFCGRWTRYSRFHADELTAGGAGVFVLGIAVPTFGADSNEIGHGVKRAR